MRFAPAKPSAAGLLGAVILGAAMVLIVVRFLQDWRVPGAGLDGSWTWATNAAAARGLVFGRDIVFNFGPYGAVATGLYDPGLRLQIIGGDLLLGAGFVAGLAVLCARRPVVLVCVAVMSPLLNIMGALAFALPLPALLLCAGARPDAQLRGARLAAVLAVLPALGLLPLIKGSFLAVTLIGCAALMLLFWQAGQRRLAVATPVLVLIGTVLLWIAAGQPADALPAYLSGMLSVISGYSDGMAMPGALAPALLAVGCCALFLAILAVTARRLPWPSGLTLLATAAGLLWVAFKAGYVRQHPGREADTLITLGLMYVALAGWLGTLPGACVAAIGVLLAAGPWTPDTLQGPTYRTILAGPEPGIDVAWRMLARPDQAALAYDIGVAALPQLPWRPRGTADIYSFDQAWLLATGLDWAPRPMFQSYSAYTPRLAAMNARHLAGAAAPDNVFFRIAPIDGRLPAQEDGPSWPALLGSYDAVAFDGGTGLAWLRRTEQPDATPKPGPNLLYAGRALGKPFDLPTTAADIWARIDLRTTLMGTMARLLMRAPQPAIRLIFADGHSRSFHLVPGMAQAGFLLSPFVATTADFLRLRGGPDGVKLSRPVAMAVDIGADGAWAWQRRYRIDLKPIAFPPQATPVRLENVPQPAQAALPQPAQGAACALDGADGDALPAGPLTASSPLLLSGWELFDASSGVQPDAMSLGLLSGDGALFATPLTPQSRPDVATAYRMKAADRAGFSIYVDLSKLPPGDYTVVGVPRHGVDTRLCRTWLTLRVKPG